VDVAGNASSTPSFYMTAGSALNFISEGLLAEMPLGFGGQYNTFNGDVNLYSASCLKLPSCPSSLIGYPLKLHMTTEGSSIHDSLYLTIWKLS